MLAVASLMQANPKTVCPTMTLTDLERLFLSSGFSGFPVVEQDHLVGMITRSDIVRSLVVERCHAEQISDFYHAMPQQPIESAEQSLSATAAQVGVRLAGLHVADAMIRTVVSVESSEPVDRVAKLMVEGTFHRVPVVEGNRLVGLVTSLDLLRAIANGQLTENPNATSTQNLLA